MRMRGVRREISMRMSMRMSMMIAAATTRSQAVTTFTIRPAAAIKIASSKWIVTGAKRRMVAS